MEPTAADACDGASTDSDRQVDDAPTAPSPGPQLSEDPLAAMRASTGAVPPPPPPPPPPREEQWNEVLGGGADGASPPTRVREASPPRESSPGEPPAAPAHPTDDAAVARLMEEYEALKAERQALAARLEARQRAEAAESAKIEAELEALAAETVALNRERARREASVYADGPLPPEETRPRQFRRKPSVTSTPWR